MSLSDRFSNIRLLFRVTVLVPLTALAVRLFGFQRTCKGLTALIRRPVAEQGMAGAYIQQVRGRIRWVKHHGIYRGNCLSRSLVLWFLLRRQGIETDLQIGTRKREGRFQAHAWVEYRDRPLNASKHVRQRYTVFEQSLFPEDITTFA